MENNIVYVLYDHNKPITVSHSYEIAKARSIIESSKPYSGYYGPYHDFKIDKFSICDDENLIRESKEYTPIYGIYFNHLGDIDGIYLEGHIKEKEAPIEPSAHVHSCSCVDVTLPAKNIEEATNIARDKRLELLRDHFGIDKSFDDSNVELECDEDEEFPIIWDIHFGINGNIISPTIYCSHYEDTRYSVNSAIVRIFPRNYDFTITGVTDHKDKDTIIKMARDTRKKYIEDKINI